MADQHAVESSSSNNVSPESSESTVELNIKTLDSQMYNFHVDKNITVSMFKEKIASEIGVPVGQQRLIFRGKVLKDNHLLSEYHVENGHTLHLVTRQVSEGQSSSGSGSGETNTNSNNAGQDANPHRVLLGTFGVGDQGEAGYPDISRVIGTVLNSINIGGQSGIGAAGGVMPNMQFNIPVPAPQGSQMEGSEGNPESQGQAGNQSNPRPAFPGQYMPQVMQIPLGTAIAVPSFYVPIPDSLNTLSVFMNHMEAALSQGGGFQSNQPSNNTAGSPPVELPSNTRGLPTPASLAIVLRHAERLFSGPAISSIAHIAERLEHEESSTDIVVRSQIQTESLRLGLVMQHLGALLLELGRTMLSIRIGQTSAESSVNAGPAVYISPSGPNPIMVQPFPLQASSLFGGGVATPPLNPTFVPISVGAVPRHVNILIHGVGPRTTNGEGTQGGVNGTGDLGQTGVMPRNVTAIAIPSRPGVVQPSIVAEINSQLRNIVANVQNESQATAGQPDYLTGHDQAIAPNVGDGIGEFNSQLRNIVANVQNESQATSGQPDYLTGDDQATAPNVGDGIGETSSPVPGYVAVTENRTDTRGIMDVKDMTSSSTDANIESSSGGKTTQKCVDNAECAPKSSSGVKDSEISKAVPLGLGLGGLQRRNRQTTSQGTSSDNDATSESSSAGRDALQSLASLANKKNSSTLTSGTGEVMEGNPSEGQIDPASVMSQVMQSPALEGFLSGVSQQSGIGSPDVFRNMLGQLTQNPAMMNTVNQIAQQIDTQDLGSMFSGLGQSGGGGGGLDLSRMVQQMIPMLSQALGGGGMNMNAPQQLSAVAREVQPSYSQRRPCSDEKPIDQHSQNHLQEVVERIEHQDPPREIFRSVVDSAVGLLESGSQTNGLPQELASDEELVNEFVEMLRRDVSKRVQDESGDGKKS